MQGFQPRKDRRKPRQKQKDEAALAALKAAEQEVTDPGHLPVARDRGPILDQLTTDDAQIGLWVAVGRGLIANGQAQACQQLFEDGLTAFGR